MGNNRQLIVKNLYVERAKKPVLTGVNLEMFPGDKVVLLGPNGSGKTTLLRAIIGKSIPSGGKIIFAGKDITGTGVRERALLGIGYLDQIEGCFPRLTVEENISLALESLAPEERNQARDRLFSLFPYLGNRLNLLAGLLSGGEKQSLSLAIQIIRRNRLLLLDEPFSGLAPEIAEKLILALDDLASGGTGILAAEQNIALSMKFSKKAFVLKRGKLFPYTVEKKTDFI
ncbi:MAG: ATP-binding cassette domain-containing protein [Candidatus Eremiobacteraeota bacterium]|nr:ATP-binding cassette domain-containing protein [Candidatus Eremiobacteraeota bacterium]